MAPAFAVDLGSECGDCLASLRVHGRVDGYGLKCFYCEYKVMLTDGGRELNVLPVGSQSKTSVDAHKVHAHGAIPEGKNER
jgi:hypothetical protein